MGFKLSNKKAKEIISGLIGEGWKAYQTSLYYEIPHGTLYGVNCNNLFITLVIRLDYFKKRVFIASHTNFKNEKIKILSYVKAKKLIYNYEILDQWEQQGQKGV